jgi:ADP-ribose pyrophosphatase
MQVSEDRTPRPDAITCVKEGIGFQSKWMVVRNDQVRMPDGTIAEYPYYLNQPVAVMPVRDGELGLGLQYRYPIRSWKWEIPRGGILPGESPADAARRELLEEMPTGPRDLLGLVELARMHPDPGRESTEAVLFAAILRPGCLVDVGEELTDIQWVSRKQMRALIDDGIVTDSFSLRAFDAACQLPSLLG